MKLKTTVFALMLVLSACSCHLLNTQVQTESIKDVTLAVVLRHDNYVAFDAQLTDEEEMLFLTEAFAFRAAVVEQPELSRQALVDLSSGVCARHDFYVEEDISLSEFERRTYLRSTKLLREVAGIEE